MVMVVSYVGYDNDEMTMMMTVVMAMLMTLLW